MNEFEPNLEYYQTCDRCHYLGYNSAMYYHDDIEEVLCWHCHERRGGFPPNKTRNPGPLD